MAAQFKEVVVAADRLKLEHLLPDCGNTAFDPGVGRNHLALPVSRLGLGQRLAVDLAVGIEWQALQLNPVQRHHVVRQLRLERGLQGLAPSAPGTRFIVGHHKGHQRLAGRAFLHNHGGFTHASQVTQTRLDFAQFDTKAAHFDLLVDTAHVFQLAVRAPPGQVAGAVQTLARPGGIRVRQKDRRAAHRVGKIPTAHARTGHVQFTDHTCGHRL